MPGKGLLERLAEGPVIGDGGFVFALEKRGYVKAGPWTPEATVEHPEAGGHVYGILMGWPGHVQTNRTNKKLILRPTALTCCVFAKQYQ